MLQFSTGILTLGHASKFAKGYADGSATKANYWEYALDDSLDLIARVPQLAAQIYKRSFHGGSSDVCHHCLFAVPVSSQKLTQALCGR